MLRVARALAFVGLVVGMFAAWLHPQVLDITNVGWTISGSDWGPAALGMAAYLRAGDWPGTWTPLIMAPNGIHLLMTDSNPLLGLLLKPIAPLLPVEVQFVGWLLLVNLSLHVVFARLLVGNRAPDFGSAWLGTALLTLLPTLYNRYAHPNLTAHWVMLWALWVFADRGRARSWRQWLAVIAVTGLIHSYLLIMVLAIWGSAMLRELAIGERRAALKGIVTGVVAVTVLGIHHGLYDPPIATGAWGAFPLALDALWNPGNPAYSAFLPAVSSPQQGYEGFQYLGVGLLFLIVVAVATSLGRRPHRDGLIWLLPTFILLTAIAVTDVVVCHGHRLLHARPAEWVIDALNPVRASSRLFWPVAYTMVYAAICAVYRLRRRTLVLVAALILQLADMTPMLVAIRGETRRAAEPGVYRRTQDARWQAYVTMARDIDVQPADPFRDQALIEELGWRAMVACRPIRFMYVARISRATQARLDADRRAFLAGQVPADRLVMLYPGEPVPAGLRPRARRLDGVTLIVPTAAAPPARCTH